MDRVLVERAMAGDRGAFNELASITIGRLYGLAVLILRDPDRASDAAQEALIAAWRDLSALRDPGRFDAWVYRVLVRACHEEARRDRRRRTVEIHEIPLERFQSDAADELPMFIDRDELERGFRRLSVEERAIVVLHHVEGFPLAAIADVLALPIGTVKSRLHRSLQTMRAALDADARVVTMERERIA
jgi:RNA polymerase sigma-70 factor (ECF subfamily)